MPLIRLTLSPAAVDPDHERAFLDALTEAALRAESVPDTPVTRARCLVIRQELSEGALTWGGEVADSARRAVFADFTCSAGVLDGARKAAFVAAFHTAATAATRPGDSRPVFTSVIFHETPEGSWGRNGAIHRLPEMARDAGFTHLQSISAP